MLDVLPVLHTNPVRPISDSFFMMLSYVDVLDTPPKLITLAVLTLEVNQNSGVLLQPTNMMLMMCLFLLGTVELCRNKQVAWK